MPSTVIQHFDYSPERCELLVVFTTGRRYIYEGVPFEAVEAFRSASSKGRYFNARIRDRFAYREIVEV